MSLAIMKPGWLTTVQDLGRTGLQQYGVIAGGAMDPLALRVANLLVGNEEGDAALEITMIGPDIRFESACLIAVCGGDLSAACDGTPIPLWRPVYVRQGARLTFGAARKGCRAYVAVAGGVDVPPRLNSRSTYLRAGIGGFQGRPLRQGDRLALRPASPQSRRAMRALERAAGDSPYATSAWSVSCELVPKYRPDPVVRVTAGTELGLFDEASVRRFFGEGFRVLPQSDRMGYRLSGGGLTLKEPVEMISAAVTFGTVQAPMEGGPIVLMADRQTTGGYPRIAQVISVDLPLLAQLNLGDRVRFRPVGLEEAQRQYMLREISLVMLRKGLFLHYAT